MIKITKKIEYALIALKHLHSVNNEHLVSAREICEKYNLPFDPVSKVLQTLQSMGMIESIKGVKGGYRFLDKLKTTSYFDLAQNLEGNSFILNCAEGNCELETNCNISMPMKKLNLFVNSVFKTITLEEIIVEELIAFNKLPVEVMT